VLGLGSLFFYGYGARGLIAILLVAMLVNYTAGRLLEVPDLTARGKRAVMAVAVVVDVGILGYWKYSGFVHQQLVDVSSVFGGHAHTVSHVALPIGISFYTFHHLSYLIDVRRGQARPLHKPMDFVAYIAMFPQLIAGPVVRFHEISDQLRDDRQDRLGDLAAGFPRFALGLAKKVVVADNLAPVADAVFGLHGDRTFASAWLGVACYTLQIYFDFSGYSDMAIGLGRMFGFRLPENFARPYSATSITDFWRRWHMSLSRWFRDYLYIPLGGNRGGTRKTYRNLVVVFALTGLWHGASWNFLLWGLYHGSLLIWERRRRDQLAVPSPLSRARTLLFVMIGWVLFRATGVGSALAVLGSMLVPVSWHLNPDVAVALTSERLTVLCLAALVVLLPRDFVAGRALDDARGPVAGAARLAVSTVGATTAAVLVVAGTFSPFLYYQF
jgi:alginate O-acetyltransferase complex protein AlgI